MAKRMRIRRDDQVKVISGKDSGKTGRVLRVDREKDRVFVEGMNIQKRHQRPRTLRDVQRGGEAGGIIEREGPIHVSNVMLLDPKTERADPRRRHAAARAAAQRVAKKSGEAID